MKKNMKSLFVLMVLGLFTIIGINTVKAESSVNNINIVCEPSAIEKGDTAFCYLIGKVTNDPSTNAGVHGLLTKVTASYLDIKSYKAGDGSAKFVAERITNGQKYSNKTPAEGIQCSTQGEVCFGFFTVGASTPGQFKNTGTGTGIPNIDPQYSSYTSFGYFEVQLDESATTTNCGELCVFADYVSAGTGYSNAVHTSEKKVCQEIKPKATVTPTTPTTPETGSFASIAVLVAGALIAIGAIAIAKKNNKIYKV